VGYPPIIGSQLIIETFYYNDISNSQSINDGSVIYDYDFVLDTNNEAILLTPNYSTSTNSSIKITTFTIQDSLGIVTQRFVGNPDNRTYKLSYPVLNSNYLWVEINSTATGLLSLINNIIYDYEREMELAGIPKIIIEKMKAKNNDTISLTIDLIEGICSSQFYSSDGNLLKIYSILNIMLSILENTISNSDHICNSINGQLKGMSMNGKTEP
jgi:hypothetical protein